MDDAYIAVREVRRLDGITARHWESLHPSGPERTDQLGKWLPKALHLMAWLVTVTRAILSP